MFCTKCGFNLSGDVKLCPNCGTEAENNNAAHAAIIKICFIVLFFM